MAWWQLMTSTLRDGSLKEGDRSRDDTLADLDLDPIRDDEAISGTRGAPISLKSSRPALGSARTQP